MVPGQSWLSRHTINVILNLPANSDYQVKVVIQPEGIQQIKGEDMDAAIPAAGVMVNSGKLTGTSCEQAIKKAIHYVEQLGVGKGIHQLQIA